MIYETSVFIWWLLFSLITSLILRADVCSGPMHTWDRIEWGNWRMLSFFWPLGLVLAIFKAIINSEPYIFKVLTKPIKIPLHIWILLLIAVGVLILSIKI